MLTLTHRRALHAARRVFAAASVAASAHPHPQPKPARYDSNPRLLAEELANATATESEAIVAGERASVCLTEMHAHGLCNNSSPKELVAALGQGSAPLHPLARAHGPPLTSHSRK